MKYKHVICQFETNIQIGVVDEFDDIKKFIYDYNHEITFPINKNGVEYDREYDEFLKDLKFTPFDGKYPDIHGYDGYYEYNYAGDISKYRVYCSDHYKK